MSELSISKKEKINKDRILEILGRTKENTVLDTDRLS